jgi:hypothetical protein
LGNESGELSHDDIVFSSGWKFSEQVFGIQQENGEDHFSP